MDQVNIFHLQLYCNFIFMMWSHFSVYFNIAESILECVCLPGPRRIIPCHRRTFLSHSHSHNHSHSLAPNPLL